MSLLFPILPKQPGLTLWYHLPPPHHPASNMIGSIERGLVNLSTKLKTLIGSDVTGLVRLSVGWLEKLQNRNRFGALIGLQPVGFGSF